MQIKVLCDIGEGEFDVNSVRLSALQSVAQVLFDVQVREQSIVLKNEPNAAPMARHVNGVVLPSVIIECQQTPAWRKARYGPQ